MPQTGYATLIFMLLTCLTGMVTTRNKTCIAKCGDACKPPKCRCLSREVPGNLNPANIPQILSFTFDDAIHDKIYTDITELFSSERKNPNGAPVTVTMFVSHEYTDYCSVSKLWEQGHEIASHSMTHQLPITWWKEASQEEWKAEMVGLKDEVVEKAGIPTEDIIGIRAPFLQGGGDKMFSMMAEDATFEYDSSLVDGGGRGAEPFWPYTLEYDYSALGCVIPPCPQHCYRGLWEVPLKSAYDNSSNACNFLDKCKHQPVSEDEAYYMFRHHLDASYNSNRALVMYNIHAVWFQENKHAKKALIRFLNEVLQRDDTYVLSVAQALEWIKDPTPLNKVKDFGPWKILKRKSKVCTIKRDRHSLSFFLSATGVLVVECLFLTFVALYLVIRDNMLEE